MVTIRPGTPSRRAIAVAATGSVGETIAPSTNASAQPKPSASWATAPTASVVASTSPTASRETARMLRRSSRSGVKKAAAYSSGGRMISRTSSGSSTTSGIPGVTASASPPTTSRIGYGIRAHWATISSSVTATRIESRASSVDMADSCSARPS